MNKSKFLELVKNPELIEEKDLTKLAELTLEHPYSQIIHVLNVKGCKILAKHDFDKALNLAAIYSYDRNVLHSIVEQISVEVVQPSDNVVQPSDDLEESAIEETSDFEWINDDLEDKDQSISPGATSDKEQPSVETAPIESNAKDEAANKEKESSEEEEPAEQSTDQNEDSLKLEIETSGIHAELMKNLSQLQESKQQYEGHPEANGDPNSDKEQIEIIDDFIKNSPVLSKPNLSAESEIISQKDLSKDSSKFSEELASENLAKIFLKQGKRKDAEKIYKKLISKFPQKKTYFADQIEKLKKK